MRSKQEYNKNMQQIHNTIENAVDVDDFEKKIASAVEGCSRSLTPGERARILDNLADLAISLKQSEKQDDQYSAFLIGSILHDFLQQGTEKLEMIDMFYKVLSRWKLSTIVLGLLLIASLV